jgi:hypothetical protein
MSLFFSVFFAELKEIADNKGLGMSSLVRMWVRERLAGNTSM